MRLRSATTWVRTLTGGAAKADVPEQRTATAYLAEEAKRGDVDLIQAALHDPVTGLPERALLLDRTALALARARRSRSEIAVLLLTTDGATDAALRDFAERVLRAVRDTDTVARFGPNDFAVLCDGVEDPDTLSVVAARIGECLRGTGLDVGMDVVLAAGDTAPIALLDQAERAVRATRDRKNQS
jgi:GGDEF domain-containing protein